MPLPADLAEKVIRWEYTASIQADGFQPYAARAEYAGVDLDTFEAMADEFNGAAPGQTYAIVVRTGPDQTPFLLCDGLVQAWFITEESSDDGRGGVQKRTVAVLEALDSRAVTKQARLDQPVVYAGVSFPRPDVGQPPNQRVPHSRFRDVLQHLASQAGLVVSVPDAVNYTLSNPLLATNSTIGELIAQLLMPLQQVRFRRVDWILTGSVLSIRQRPFPLPTPDFTIAAAHIARRTWRRTRPKPPRVEPEETVLATEFDGGVAGRTAESPLDTWGFQSELIQIPDGTVFNSYHDGKLIRQIVDRTVSGISERTERNVLLGPNGEMRGTDEEVTRAGVRVFVITYRVIRNPAGAIVAEHTLTLGRDQPVGSDPGGLLFMQSVVVTKARVGSGTVKTTIRSRRVGTTIFVDAPAHEFSAGDTHAVDDPFGNSPAGVVGGPYQIGHAPGHGALMQEQADVAAFNALAAQQAAMDLVEMSCDFPLLPELLPGMVIAFDESPVETERYYVTSVRHQCDVESQRHTTSADAEAWVAP